MTNRVLIGAGRGSYGLWVSKAGFNVKTCNEGDLLFSSNNPAGSLLYMFGGVVIVASSGSQQVLYPAFPGGGNPVVFYQVWRTANGYVQPGEYDGYEDYRMFVENNKVTFSNSTGLEVKFRYKVFAKDRGF